MKLKFRAEPKDVVIFIMFAIFLLYLVAIAILNLHSLTVESRFWGLNPFPAFFPEYIAATLVFYLLALVGLAMTVSSYFFDREKGFGYEPGKKNEDGFARFSSASEMKKKPDIHKILLADDEYKYAGIPLMLNEKEAWVDNGESHSLVMGGTGSGKTECVMKPMAKILAKAGESMIFTDPKGELYKDIAGLLKERGYNVIVLNFREPLRGNCWNPFSLPFKFFKEGKDDKSKELIEDLAYNILVDPDNKAEPFWEETASAYFAGLSMALFKDAQEEYVNINSINQMATVGEEMFGNKSFLQAYFKDKGETSTEYVSVSATINAPNDTKGSIVSTFKSKIRIFSSREALSEMLSKTDFDFSQIGKQKTAIFLVIHDEKKTYHSLLTIFLKQIYESLIDVASSQPNLKLPIRTNFLLDEFANMPPLRDVDAMITASRSRNIRFNFIIQNYSQLNKQYGPDMAETLKGNVGNIHFLTTTELKALEEISKLCGEKKGKSHKDKPDDPVRPLVTVSDLQKLKQFEFLILRLRCQPFKTQFKTDFQIDKVNGWGAKYDPAEFPVREPNTPKIFDIKEFVKNRATQKMMHDVDAMSGSGAGSQKAPPISPFMMGQNKNTGKAMPNMDEFLKNIDATIAKLEAEEKAEKERLAKQKQKPKEIEDKKEIIEPKVEQPKEEKSDKEDLKEKANKPLVIESKTEPEITATEIPKEQAQEKKVEVSKIEVPKEVKEIPVDETTQEEEKPKSEPIAVETKEEITPVIKPEIPAKSEKESTKPKEELSNELKVEVSKDELKPEISNKADKELQGQEIQKLMSEIAKPKEEKLEVSVKEESKEVSPPKSKPTIEKPKINVDVDSIVVDDNITDDEFFDDFFGDDDDEE